MRWGDFRRSDNVEDRTGGLPEGSGGGGGMGFGGIRLGGGAMIILVIVGMLFGINPFEMLGMLGGDGGPVQAPPQQSAPPGYGPQTQAPPATGAAAVNMDFSKAILGDTEDVWGALFKAMGRRYEPPKLVLYRGGTRSNKPGVKHPPPLRIATDGRITLVEIHLALLLHLLGYIDGGTCFPT